MPIEGGTPIKLNGPLVAGGDVGIGEQISPNGQWVIYRADQDTDELDELYSVPITGGSATKINSNLPASAEIFVTVRLSNDNQFIVYQSDQNNIGQDELFSVQVILPELPEVSETEFYTIPVADGKVVVFPL